MSIFASILILGAAQSAAAAPAAQQADEPNPTEIVCQYKAKVGTRFKTKKCATRAQWELMRENHIRGAREMIERPLVNIGRG